MQVGPCRFVRQFVGCDAYGPASPSWQTHHDGGEARSQVSWVGRVPNNGDVPYPGRVLWLFGYNMCGSAAKLTLHGAPIAVNMDQFWL